MLKKHIPVVIVLINLKSRRQNRYFGLQVSAERVILKMKTGHNVIKKRISTPVHITEIASSDIFSSFISIFA